MNPSNGANEEANNQPLIENVEDDIISQFFLIDESLAANSAEQMEHVDVQRENPLAFPTGCIPLFSFNPNSFPYVLTYDQPAVAMQVKTLVSPETNENGSVDGASGTKNPTTVKFPTNLEKNVDEVKKILIEGCLCSANTCFAGFDPEYIYRHRMNVLNLRKPERNMFLLGAIVTCFMNSDSLTSMKYYFQGKGMCKDAFLYLLCCSLQQLSEIQDHLMNYGVVPLEFSTKKITNPKPFFAEVYKSAKEFLFKYVEKHCGKKGAEAGRYISVPHGTTKKSLHQAYTMYVRKYTPGRKLMAYSTFRNFLSEYFPHIIFYKYGGVSGSKSVRNKENEKTVAVGNIEAVSPFAAIPPHDYNVQCQNQDSWTPSASINFLEYPNTEVSSSTNNF